jgi:hypothetical protein
MKEPIKVLFLDIDGVLNATDSSLSWYPFHGEEQSQSDGYDKFDERCVRWLRGIVALTGCKIVVSSTWRLSMRGPIFPGGMVDQDLDGQRRFEDMWLSRNMPDVIIGRTPRIPGTRRGNEIWTWLDRIKDREQPISSYCILDDDGDMLEEQMPNFVQCNSDYGITDIEFRKALKILGLRSDLPKKERDKWEVWILRG